MLRRLLCWLANLFACEPVGEPIPPGMGSGSVTMIAKIPGFAFLGVIKMLLQDDQQVEFSFQALDAAGNPARFDGVPAWASSDESIVTVAPSADGLACMVTAVGPLGTAQVSVKVDADLGAGVRELIGTADIEVVGGEAVVIQLTAGAPTPKA